MDFHPHPKRTAVGSRITLTSPDPSAAHKDTPNAWDTVHSDKDEVAFVPSLVDSGTKVNDQKVRGSVEDIRIEL